MEAKGSRFLGPNGPQPPLYFLVALGLQVLLNWLVPLVDFNSALLVVAGAILVVLGIVMIVQPAQEFERARTSIDPFGKPSVLKTDGWFQKSRNPMYLGMAAALLGVALVLRTLTPLLVVPAFVWLITERFIRREEETLKSTFGAQYDAYCRRVRRWW